MRGTNRAACIDSNHGKAVTRDAVGVAQHSLELAYVHSCCILQLHGVGFHAHKRRFLLDNTNSDHQFSIFA
jgi:hypothetical protein